MILTYSLLLVSLVIHELGHMLAALLFHVKVREFCIFLDPFFRIIDTKNAFNTRICLGWIPFGAYILYDNNKDGNNSYVNYQNLHPLKRIVISLSGVISNFIMAYICIFACVSINLNMDHQRGIINHIKYTNNMACNEVLHSMTSIKKNWNSISPKQTVNNKDTMQKKVKYVRVRASRYNVSSILWKMVLLNMFLVIFNLIPIPPLDGAHTLYNLYEYTFHKPVNLTFQFTTGIIGFLIILGSDVINIIRYIW